MSKLQEDNVFVGMLVSLFFTVTMFYVFYQINESLDGAVYVQGKLFGGVQERFISTLAVFFNIIPFVIYMRTKKDNCMRGVGIVTVLLAMFMLVFYYVLHNDYLLS
jgi:hypothetical protein